MNPPEATHQALNFLLTFEIHRCFQAYFQRPWLKPRHQRLSSIHCGWTWLPYHFPTWNQPFTRIYRQPDLGGNRIPFPFVTWRSSWVVQKERWHEDSVRQATCDILLLNTLYRCHEPTLQNDDQKQGICFPYIMLSLLYFPMISTAQKNSNWRISIYGCFWCPFISRHTYSTRDSTPPSLFLFLRNTRTQQMKKKEQLGRSVHRQH